MTDNAMQADAKTPTQIDQVHVHCKPQQHRMCEASCHTILYPSHEKLLKVTWLGSFSTWMDDPTGNYVVVGSVGEPVGGALPFVCI